MHQAGGLVPAYIQQVRPHDSPIFLYPREYIWNQLKALENDAGSPYDGIILRLSNANNGGFVPGPTMGIQVQLLRPAEKTRAHRHNTSTIFIAAKGNGTSIVGENTYKWEAGDVFVVPGWVWHEHENTTSDDAILYSISDQPIIEAVGLYREQRKKADGSIEDIGWYQNERKYIK